MIDTQKEKRGTHPSADSGGTANQEDATLVLSNHELANNSSKNLNNGLTTTNPQSDHTKLKTHTSRATTDTRTCENGDTPPHGNNRELLLNQVTSSQSSAYHTS